MTKIEKLKKALEDFNYAGQTLSTIMEEVEYDSLEAKAMEMTAHKFPFPNSFNEISYSIHTWCSDTIEQLDHEEIEEFCKSLKYVMSLEECVTGGGTVLEKYWFFSTKNTDNFGEIRVVEEIEGGGYNVNWEDFKEKFIIIPKELFELAMTANEEGDYQAICKIQDLAKIIGKAV